MTMQVALPPFTVCRSSMAFTLPEQELMMFADTKPFRLGDQLAGKNGIPLFYNWLCWFSNVLVDREDKLSFGEKFFDRTIFGEVFVSVWMDASPKRFVTHTIPPV